MTSEAKRGWIAIEAEAAERRRSVRWLRTFCRAQGVPITGTRKSQFVRTADIDRALERQAEVRANDDAEAADLAAAQPPTRRLAG